VARFEWTGIGKNRTLMYGTIARFGEVDRATHQAALTVEIRANQNLAAAHHHVRIVPHKPHKIELTKGGGKYPASSYNVSLVGDNPMALEYGHEPSGHFAGTKTKAPAGTYILHRAADLAGTENRPRMGRDFRVKTGRSRPVGEDG
jgi:hypothetical protein